MTEKAKIGIVAGVIVVLLVFAIMTPFSIFWIEIEREAKGENLNKLVAKYESEWKIDISEGINVEYSYVADKVKYSYAKYESEPTSLTKDMAKDKDDTFENKFKSDMESISGDIAVKSVINWSNSYYYLEKNKESSKLYIVYFPSDKSIYLYEIKA